MQFHSPSLLTLTTSKPHSSNLLVTISTLSWIIPDVIKYPFGLITLLTSSVKIQIISAIMLATTISALPSITSIKFPCKIYILSILLNPTFSLADSTATGSKSTPTASFAPSLAAAIASIPEPQPTSNTVLSF